MRDIIMDVDTGSDDAVAIMAALLCGEIDVKAICTTALLPLEVVTDNTLKVLNLIGSDVPVYMGAPRAMVKGLSELKTVGARFNPSTTINGRVVHMHNAFDLEIGDKKARQTDAVSFYVDYLKNVRKPITVVATAPLTNLALALTMNRGVSRGISEIVLMGAGYKCSNLTSCAESNFWRDPEAAQKVLSSGIKITVFSLDATHSAALDERDRDRVAAIKSPAARFATRLIDERMAVYKASQPFAKGLAAPLHDALCVAYLVRPDVVRYMRRCHCEVDCSDGPAQGQSIIDNRAFTDSPNVDFVLRADHRRFCDFLCETFESGVEK